MSFYLQSYQGKMINLFLHLIFLSFIVLYTSYRMKKIIYDVVPRLKN